MYMHVPIPLVENQVDMRKERPDQFIASVKFVVNLPQETQTELAISTAKLKIFLREPIVKKV